MIRLVRPPLSDELAGSLQTSTAKIAAHAVEGRPTHARVMWDRAPAKDKLRVILAEMASGQAYCMYCSESIGTDIDHFEPIHRNPLRTFDWLNHLLACTTCNNRHKGKLFPVDTQGLPLLIDPTVDDPFDHLQLRLSTGKYRALTIKGKVTIEVCGLARPLLIRGRANARWLIAAYLEKWLSAYRSGNAAHQAKWTTMVRQQPYADVCQAMLRQVDMPGAAEIFAENERRLLRMPELREALLT